MIPASAGSYLPELPKKASVVVQDANSKENPSKPKFKPIVSAKQVAFAGPSQQRRALGTISGNGVAGQRPLGSTTQKPSAPTDSILGSSSTQQQKLDAGKQDPLSRLISETSARNAAMRETKPKHTVFPGSKQKSLMSSHLQLTASNGDSLVQSSFISVDRPRVKLVAFRTDSLMNSSITGERKDVKMRQVALSHRADVASCGLRQQPQMSSNENESAKVNRSNDEKAQRRELEDQEERMREARQERLRREAAALLQQKANEEQQAKFKEQEQKKKLELENRAVQEALQQEQAHKEEEARRQALQDRASELERNGQIAAALAVIKEAVSLAPEDTTLKSTVRRLRGLLLQSSASQVSDDPLEALFASGARNTPEPGEIETNNQESQNEEAAPTPSIGEPEALRIIETYSNNRAAHRFLEDVLVAAKGFIQISNIQNEYSSEPGYPRQVRFNQMDCAIDPPGALVGSSEEDFASALYPLDMLLEAMQSILRATEEMRKLSKTEIWREPLQDVVASMISQRDLQNYTICALLLGSGHPCSCMAGEGVRFCKRGAIPLRDRLGQLLSMGLRFCLRRLFNQRGYFLDPSAGGSYRYAMDDVAAVTHTALLLYETRLSVVDSAVLLGKTSRSDADAQIARVGEFVEAHSFLCTLFPSEQACQELSDSDPACFAKLRKYLALAREFKCEDELVLSPLAHLTDLVKKLKEQANLVHAARSHVELAFKRAAKDDKCGQCTCEGARRRRAAAIGTWIAPQLQHGEAPLRHGRVCSKCTKSLAEKEPQIGCECCERMFHPKCAGVPQAALLKDFVCSKCVPRFKPIAAPKDDEEDAE